MQLKYAFSLCLFFFFVSGNLFATDFRQGIKTNLLYDATTTFNLGLEFRTGAKTSFDIPVSYNPWTFSDNKKWKHILIQPEFRRWRPLSPDESRNVSATSPSGGSNFKNIF